MNAFLDEQPVGTYARLQHANTCSFCLNCVIRELEDEHTSTDHSIFIKYTVNKTPFQSNADHPQSQYTDEFYYFFDVDLELMTSI